VAISAALRVLGILEFPEDDVPPEEMWHHEEYLTDWFEAVKWKRTHPNETRIDDDDDDDYVTNKAIPKVGKRRRR